ncbi:MAG: EAL domain-containing response regulator [Proteobacteria bacterium]|nr:EAL domain-containing response regulator [Pseudomonadota bacterium]
MSNRTILILDDEPEIGAFLDKVATGLGFRTSVTTSADDFKRTVSGSAPAHILLDLQMPGVDGIEMLRWLADTGCRANIVIMSGFDHKVIDSARRLGIERGLTIPATLQKPFRVTDVAKILDAIAPSADVIDAMTIRHGLQQKHFFLVYQPKVSLRDPAAGAPGGFQTEGFEALIRWRHPRRGVVPPVEFLKIAERDGLMDELTETVLEMSLAQMKAWSDEGLETSININVSAQNMHNAAFADRLAAHCLEAAIDPSCIVLELTETAAMSDPVTAMDILTRLRLKGFRLSIDDFGTGYSSLVQLHMLPFSELKIDRAFIAECDKQNQSRMITKTIIDLARNLGLQCVAEGVETAETLALLRDMGCDMAQGYFIAKPMSADAATEWLRSATPTVA